MKFSLLPLAFLTTLVAAQDLGSLDVSDLYVDKHEDPLTLQIKVHYVSFTINGTNADNIHCEATTPQTFPMTDPVKCDGDTNWHFILGTGSEGSGIQFDVVFYYQGTGVTLPLRGQDDAPTRCKLNPDYDLDEFRYECNQLVPVTIPLTCLFGCLE